MGPEDALSKSNPLMVGSKFGIVLCFDQRAGEMFRTLFDGDAGAMSAFIEIHGNTESHRE